LFEYLFDEEVALRIKSNFLHILIKYLCKNLFGFTYSCFHQRRLILISIQIIFTSKNLRKKGKLRLKLRLIYVGENGHYLFKSYLKLQQNMIILLHKLL